LKQNDITARALRQRFESAGVFAVSLVSSPGAGKTMLLEKTLLMLRERYRVAALVGDLATDNDAKRLARSEVPVRQIVTGTVCHLEAEMVQTALDDWSLEDLDFLFIENVGNLVCPASYDLGEALRIVLFSVTEGEDKPLKYPDMFAAADLMLLNKADLLPHLEYDVGACIKAALRVNPRMQVMTVSARTGEGLPEFYEWIELRASSMTDSLTQRA
jgi:hydrogenase nickel incorporation protein HypB